MMKKWESLIIIGLIVFLTNIFLFGQDKSKEQIENPRIDYKEFLKNAQCRTITKRFWYRTKLNS